MSAVWPADCSAANAGATCAADQACVAGACVQRCDPVVLDLDTPFSTALPPPVVGAALAGIRLAKRQEKRKVMLVLSDGQPAGGPKCQPHLRSVIKNLEEKFRIETVGIGIMDSSVSRFYPKYVVLNNAADLPGQVMTEIKKLLV